MKVLVAIPVYNEEQYLRGVLAAVRRQISDVLVIDDGSTDRTACLLGEFADVAQIRHPDNRGYGQSLIDAFAFADRRGYDWVITMDCDEQHEPRQIPEFVAAAAVSAADVISGSRYLVEDDTADPPPPERRRINHQINALIERVLGLRLTDSFCGFKAHRVSAMRGLQLTEPGYAFPMQFWVQCVRAGLRIVEIPVARIYHDHDRQFGGTLDDPTERLDHYLQVFRTELRCGAVPVPAEACFAEMRCH